MAFGQATTLLRGLVDDEFMVLHMGKLRLRASSRD